MFYKLISYLNFKGKGRVANLLWRFFKRPRILHPNRYPAEVVFYLDPKFRTDFDLLWFGCLPWLLDDLNFIKTNLSKKKRGGGVIIDVGANIGLYSLFFSKGMGARVISFEPVPQIFWKLQENIALNNSPIVAEQVALGETNGMVDLWIPSDLKLNSGHSTITKDKSHLKDDSRSISIKVPVTTIDSYCEKNNLGAISLIKLDVEGAEGTVLRGARETIRKYSPVVFFEVTQFNQGDFEKTLEDFLYLLPNYEIYFQDHQNKIPIKVAISSGKIYNGNWLALRQ